MFPWTLLRCTVTIFTIGHLHTGSFIRQDIDIIHSVKVIMIRHDPCTYKSEFCIIAYINISIFHKEHYSTFMSQIKRRLSFCKFHLKAYRPDCEAKIILRAILISLLPAKVHHCDLSKWCLLTYNKNNLQTVVKFAFKWLDTCKCTWPHDDMAVKWNTEVSTI